MVIDGRDIKEEYLDNHAMARARWDAYEARCSATSDDLYTRHGWPEYKADTDAQQRFDELTAEIIQADNEEMLLQFLA